MIEAGQSAYIRSSFVALCVDISSGVRDRAEKDHTHSSTAPVFRIGFESIRW